MKGLGFAFFILYCSVSLISAQRANRQTPNISRAHIPARLQLLLEKRLEEFVEVQRREKWERIFDFLISTQNGAPFGQFDAEQKQCIVEQIRAAPMNEFTYLEYEFSTYNLNVPLGRKFWNVYGNAEFKDASKGKTSLLARYFNQNWFFSVPNYYYKKWERQIEARADLSADLSNLLEVIEQPDSPVEIFDISVKIDPKYYSLRDYKFKGRNKSGKTIAFFRYQFVEAGVNAGGGSDLKPGEAGETDGSYSANHPFCKEKELPVRVYISRVHFTDGTRWISKIKPPQYEYAPIGR